MALRPYQRDLARFIAERQHGLVISTMGTGKTLATLVALALLKRRGELGRALIVSTPAIVQTVWRQEAAKFGIDLSFALIAGTPAKRLALRQDVDVALISADLVDWLVAASDWRFDTVVFDESTLFKNPSSRRTKAIKKVLPRITRSFGLTGTPAANGLADLFGQALVCGIPVWGPHVTHFRDRFMVNAGRQYPDWKLRAGAEQRIYADLKPWSIVVRAEDVERELPELVEQDHRFLMPAAAHEHYDELVRELVLELEAGDITAPNAAALSNKLRQLASGFLYDGERQAHWLHQAKLDALSELLEQLGDEQVLIVYQFKAEREAIGGEYIGGDVSAARRADLIARWNRGELRRLLIHPASAGHGLSLHGAGARHVVHFSLTWNLEHYLQVTARLRRKGHAHRTVFCHRLVADTRIEATVARALAEKINIQTALLEAL